MKHELVDIITDDNGLYRYVCSCGKKGLRFKDSKGAERQHKIHKEFERRFDVSPHPPLGSGGPDDVSDSSLMAAMRNIKKEGVMREGRYIGTHATTANKEEDNRIQQDAKTLLEWVDIYLAEGQWAQALEEIEVALYDAYMRGTSYSK